MNRRNKRAWRCLLTGALAVCMLLGCAEPALAGNEAGGTNVTLTETSADTVSAQATTGDIQIPTGADGYYQDTDKVRVSIVLDKPSTISAGYSTAGIAGNKQAMSYRASLSARQQSVGRSISRNVLDGEDLDVVWNLTLAANLISANVPYAAIEKIRTMPGVAGVYIETRYEPETVSAADPDMAVSGEMTGTHTAWNAGFSGAGSRIAVVDTGTDVDHQSFNGDAFDYALILEGADAVFNGEFDTVDDYIASLDLLDVEEIRGVFTQLNAVKNHEGILTPEDLYLSSKLAFAYNYVDKSLDVTHINDPQGEHGSHVAGIATANRYIPSGDSYALASDTVHVVGQAPEAQLITMKVFGAGGGAYDSDYVAAIEDAIMLGCDAINLSLGSTSVGFAYSGIDYYDQVFKSLQGSDTVVTISAGNNASWAEGSGTEKELLYSDDVNNDRVGSPSAYKNSLSVASVDNNGFVGPHTDFTASGGSASFMTVDAGSTPPGYKKWASLDTTPDGSGTQYDYVFLGDPSPLLDPDYSGPDTKPDYLGTPEDFEGLDLSEKIVLVARGDISFSRKQENADAAKAKAILVYNNSNDSVSMDLSDSASDIPCAILSLRDARKLFAMTGPGSDGTRSGKITVGASVYVNPGPADAQLYMSSFSSFGVPENLTMKPEITAPGGNIYSVNGMHTVSGDEGESIAGGHEEYESMSGTSMAAPQVAGMSALMMQYIYDGGLDRRTGLSPRTLAQSLLMSTSVPITEEESGLEYSVRIQGSGLANVANAISSTTYLLVGDADGNDGKVKAEFGDDPGRQGVYTFDFTVYNMGEETSVFALEDSVLAPDIVTGARGSYMANTMRALDPSVTYEKPLYDFDGDGDEDRDDVQALLDLMSGNRESISHRELADLGGNGEIDPFDAHLLMVYLEAAREQDGQIVLVPAGGETTVGVTVTLSAGDREYLDAGFKNGAYVEGYLYLNALPDELGAVGVSHSIPMLGFYGDWGDGSMYDRGTYVEEYYAALNGQEVDDHYVTPSADTNYMVYRVNGSQYRYGINMYAPDSEYLPERAAVSAKLGGTIYGVYYTLIRNSAGGRVRVQDDSSGKIYLESTVGRQSDAFYSAEGQAWENALIGAAVGWSGTDEEGAPLQDGTRVTVSLTTASEYYRDADGTIRWDEAGDGGVLSMPAVIDNVEPVISKAEYDEVDNSLTVTVSDNHYLAALVLYNENGTAVLKRLAANQTVEGGQLELKLDLNGIVGESFKLMAADYAGNCHYYDARIDRDSNSGELYAFSPFNLGWVSFGEAVDGNESVVAVADESYKAGTFARGYFFAINGDNELYAFARGDLGRCVLVKKLYNDYIDLTFDQNSGKLYGLRNYGNRRSYLYTIDPETASEEFAFAVSADLKSIAADGTGGFYSLSSNGRLYHVEGEGTPRSLGSLGRDVSGAQSTVYSGGVLYWADGEELLTVSTLDGSVSPVGSLSGPVTCLSVPVTGVDDFEPAGTVKGIIISGGDIETLIGNKIELSAAVRPWYVSDGSVDWATADGDVLSVDGDGVVTAIGTGTGTVTATSRLTPSVSTGTGITVFSLPERISGVTMAESGAAIYDRSFATGAIGRTDIPGAGGLVASTYDAKNGQLWVMDMAGTIHRVDEATGDILSSVASGSGLGVYDMEYSQVFGGYWSVYGTYLLVPTGFDENMPLSGFDFRSLMEENSKGTSFIAVASVGEIFYNNTRCEQVICVDNAGGVWNVLVYKNGASYGAYLGQGTVDIAGKFMGNTGHSAIYDPYYGEDGGILLSLYNGRTSTVYAVNMGDMSDVRELARTEAADSPLSLYRAVADTGRISAPGGMGIPLSEAGLEITMAVAEE